MKGESKVTLTTETMILAVQEYFDKQFTDKHVVKSLKEVDENPGYDRPKKYEITFEESLDPAPRV